MPPIKKTLASKLKSEGVQPSKPEPREPVWKGPHSSHPQGGITQSLLNEFLCCRERFRLRVMDGLGQADSFNHRIEYGSMWHICEEFVSQGQAWEGFLRDYAKELCRKYPLQQEQVQHWYNVCKVQFPLYMGYWAKHPDVKERTVLLPEVSFKVPYVLPSTRVVWLRGKWDSVDLIDKGKSAGIYLQENKTKGDIVEEQLKRQLQFDLQTMFYLVALQSVQTYSKEGLPEYIDPSVSESLQPTAEHLGNVVGFDKPILGVRYNVIRRPLSGSKGSIRKHQPSKSNPLGESDEDFYKRLSGVLAEEPSYQYMRWKVEVTQADIERFKREFLNPILEQLCDWWDWVSTLAQDPFDTQGSGGIHWRTPYGIWNTIADGGSTELDEYLATGSELGLVRGKPLFEELD